MRLEDCACSVLRQSNRRNYCVTKWPTGSPVIVHYYIPFSLFLISRRTHHLSSVWPCIVDDMKRVKPTRCYTMVYWTLWIAQHVPGITVPIVRSLRLYRWSQRLAPHLGYGRLLFWCMAVGFWSVRLEGCFTCPKHDERFIRSNKPLCSIELVLFSPLLHILSADMKLIIL